MPLSYYSEDLGEVELPALKMVITDAQGNAIRTTEARTNITFEFQRSDGRVIKVKDTAVFGQVTQPLFAVGKLYKVGWGIEPQDAYSAFLTKLVKRKNGTSVSNVPIRFSRNSTVTDLRIYRAAMGNGQDDVPISIRKLTLTKELKDDIENGKYEEGWFYLTDGRPVRIDWDVNTTYSLERDEGKSFKYRTTLRTRNEEEQIVWEEMEFYECAEEWREKGTMVIVPEIEKAVVITIMERFPRSVEDYGEYSSPYKRKEPEEKRDVEMEPQEQEDLWKGRSEEELQREIDKGIEELAQAPRPGANPGQHLQEEKNESERKKVEEQLPKLGEAMDERMKIGGIELTPASTLKQLRNACEFLKVGKTGSKAQIWQRLKEAVASNKMKELVEISKGLEVEFSGEPDGEKRPEAPSEEERKRHELTHLPKADWCESCSATRSREDDFKITEKKYEASLVSMDFKFTGTRNEEDAKDVKDALCISLVMVDQETKSVHAIPVQSKEVTSYLVEEVCRVLMLMQPKVILRTDTEPAMSALRKKVQTIRKMQKLETEIQDVAPDTHQGAQVERWVQTVRNLSKTLVYGVEKEAKGKDHKRKYTVSMGTKTCSIPAEQVCCTTGEDPVRVGI